ncbi:putative DNA binding domain-containing protein [Xenophilus arseniciresistens]|uniref:DNA binding domain-containing protein n=1 Tax=Xenophilus arseniciresistens TaxID=1283306 RepID=A0AAE3T2V9_9BURK|nr:ATP-binding protein [Xenophilus arseniciresistens]MDA7418837.1 putative DNA binding domain-containing protein [Xenophilus arseniciresistens]
MPIEIREIAAADAKLLRSLTEGHFADAKALEVAPAKLSRSISALANADGGELFVGLREDRENGGLEWRGFSDPEDANGHIQLFEKLFPLGVGFEYEFLKAPRHSGLVLHITVAKAAAVVRSSDDVPYLRRGAQNLPISTESALKQLERDKGLTSYENETVATPKDTLTDSEVTKNFIKTVVPHSAPDMWLRKQQLLIGDRPTVGGVILFADLPQAVLPKRCGIKVYRYKTSQSEGTREALVGNPQSVEGHAYSAIHESVALTQSIISELQVLGHEGLTAVRYPPETLHEVITNAVLHRDYSLADDVHIRIFDNRVEVESPGKLPGHVTVQNILSERFARNGNLVRVINKFPNPPNKDVGEGLNTAFAAMRQLKLKDPTIEERPNSVVVHIKHEKLASAEELVLDYLRSNESITNPIARSLTGLGSENAMKNVFYRLRDRNLLEQVPGLKGNKSAWRLTKKGKQHIAES